MKTNLKQVTTKDDLILSGLYNEGDKSKPAIVMVHGFTSDFYSHKFFLDIQESLQEKNIASVSIQTRGTGIRTEMIKADRKDGTWIGSFYEKLNEAHLDISAWIRFLKTEGYSNIILAGHSLGTVKTVRYLFEGEYKNDISKIILLAPFDKNGYLERKNPGLWREHVKAVENEIENGNGEKTVSNEFEDYLMSNNTFVSWYEDSELSNMWDFYKNENYDGTLLKQIDIPVQIIVGDKDSDFFMPEISTMAGTKKILKENIKNLDLQIIEGAGHTYVGFEDQVVDAVDRFINT